MEQWKKQVYPKVLWNSIINKAPLTAKANRKLGGHAPSAYTKTVEKQLGSAARLDEILETHLVDPTLLRADDFHGFIRHRATALLDRIVKATGRSVTGRDSDEVKKAFGGPLLAPPAAAP